jgi:hypothetical protein
MFEAHPSNYSLYRFYLGVFLISFLTQLVFWQLVPLVDATGWQERIEAFYRQEWTVFDSTLFANPDAAMITVAVIGRLLNLTVGNSLIGSTALLNALGVAGCVITAYSLRPRTPWWLMCAAMLIFNSTYLESTPHDAILAPFITLIILLSLYVYEHPSPGYHFFLLFSMAMGIALATFLPLALLFIVPTLGFLMIAKRLTTRQFLFIGVSSLMTLFLFDPLFFIMPINHLYAVFGQTFYHTIHFFFQPPLPFLDFLNVAPFAILSFALGSAWAFSSRKHDLPIPRPFLVFLFILSLLIVSVLLSARYQTFRSFHSLIFIWDIFLPLFIFQLADQVGWFRSQRMKYGLITLLLVAPLLELGIGYFQPFPAS